MKISVNVRTRVEPNPTSWPAQETGFPSPSPDSAFDAAPSPPQRSRSVRLLAAFALLAAGFWLLWINIGFARYAVTGLFWDDAGGTVLNSRTTSSPAIQFTTPDGAAHTFSEDYILLCQSRHSLCFVRTFQPGQFVPVVYDPTAPQRAYIHDWALTSGVMTWFLEAACTLFFALMIAVILRRKPLNASIRIGTN